MRIFQRETNRVFEDIELFLTAGELLQLSSYAQQLIKKPSIHHCHLTGEKGNRVFKRNYYCNSN